MKLAPIGQPLILALLTFASLRSAAQVKSSNTSSADTAKAISPDSLRARSARIIPQIGSIDRTLVTSEIEKDSSIKFTDYRYAGDLLTMFPGIFIREFGGPGQLPDLTIDGVDSRAVVVMNDGISLNDPYSGRFNLYLYPTENIDHVEVVTDPRSFLYGLNSTAGALNFVSENHTAIHPYSRLRYSESTYGFGFIDGMVSEDIARGLNATAGAQHFTFGNRYPNDSYDAWTGRAKVRYNISREFNVFVSELYNQTQLGLNGGVDRTATPDTLWFDPLQAIVKSTTGYEKITRHDAQVGLASRLRSDSNAVNTLTFYLSSDVREFGDNGTSGNSTSIQQDQRSQWMGVRATQHRIIGAQMIDVGGDLQSQRVLVTPATNESRATLFSLFGDAQIHPAPVLAIRPSIRFDDYRKQTAVGYGGEVSTSIVPSLELSGGYSKSFRFPTFQERSGTSPILSSSITDEAPERHSAFQLCANWRPDSQASVGITAFHRTIQDLITVSSEEDTPANPPFAFVRHDNEVLRGIDAHTTFRVGCFFFEATGQLTNRSDAQDNGLTFPKWTGTGGAYYWDELFTGHLRLKAGLRGRFFSNFRGLEYSQQAMIYLPGDGAQEIPSTGTIDLVILAHLGDAYLHILWDNLLDREYVMANFFPMPQRQLRFGVTWEFLD